MAKTIAAKPSAPKAKAATETKKKAAKKKVVKAIKKVAKKAAKKPVARKVAGHQAVTSVCVFTDRNKSGL